ncbi:putative nicotinate-nucleotide adenylyltransferase [Sporosarcina sp. NCCP-2716]|uniref:nicotinate-nucleotide adenylyltransferase n=1 Tax=Sporosarcina sp. NCCP-2716 TaxID=2943679 RepID=UPI00203B5D19|nr:nicotinate-nucleotide adenylyltransferase [Sporosarcina sp. NCCP-2716]GKV68018.1 putative nicotinate-nucleotide adenylyltransferase [Sporosarcina sp. NCCP-2716]
MRKIGILGGTFNPPHIGHLIMADEVCDALGLDEVRLMPTAIPPHKLLADTASPRQRLEMTALAVQGNSRLTVCDEEVASGGVSYTVITMGRLMEKEPDAEFHFIIGGDMIDSLHTWRGIDRLLTMVRFVGVRRPGTAGHTELPINYVEVPLIDVSSTMLRNRYRSQRTTGYLIPPSVDRYIRKERLYGS